MTDDDRNSIIAALYRHGKRDWPWWTTEEIAGRAGMSIHSCSNFLNSLRNEGAVIGERTRRAEDVSMWRATDALKREFQDGPVRITRRLTANFDQPVKARGVAK